MVEAVEASETIFREVADAAPVPLWRSGLDGGCTYVNRAWREFTGRSLEAALDQGWVAGIHPDDVAATRAAAALAHARRMAAELEFRLRRRDGAWRWIRHRRAPLWRDGAFAGALGCCLDVTDFRDKDDECRRAIAERDMLLAELQHRVRNNAQTSTSLLSLQAGRATDRLVATALRAAALRIGLSTLAQELMLAADPDSGVELGQAAAAMAQAAIGAGAPPGLSLAPPRLTLEVHRRTTVRLLAARAQPLVLAVGELVVNAARHAYPADVPGRIVVTLERTGDGAAELSVVDDGVGLPLDRPERSATGQLGLHLAAKLAHQAGGALVLHAGDGTQARLRFTG